jgi:alpha-ketoglutaric semialdehyde dehydrogenase
LNAPQLTGAFFVGASRVTSKETFAGFDPTANKLLEPAFSAAAPADVARACELADAAFDVFRETSLEARALFLEKIAENILGLGDALIERAMAETGLPRARLEGERGRTIGQLKLFAHVVRRGDFLGVRVDPALPERTPLPRPDLRLRKIAIGPVAVFGASNFPLAFSVAGGDTASAFAAGCPVVCKGHPAHPGVSELVGGAIVDAVKESGLPEGVFSLLNGASNELGGALVTDPRIKAVGFTGSRGGGLALMRLANARPQPIPVYAEMSSVNPILLLPHALEARAEALAASFAGSLTMGAGQFCTNPGLVLALRGPALDRFTTAAAQALSGINPIVMLTPGIHGAYTQGVDKFAKHARVETLKPGGASETPNHGAAALFVTSAKDFLADAALAHEVFGAASLIVRCEDASELRAVLTQIEGQLTATLHMDQADHALAATLLPLLERKAGRVLANAWPTGVEVSHAMVHGGPFPATSDGASTSVGTLAIDRYLRPVCYQDIPDVLLPAAVKHDNPLGLSRLVEGVRQG